MKKQYFLLLICMTVGQALFAQIVNIPDVNFKSSLLSLNTIDSNSDGFFDTDVDTNNDGEIQLSEALLVTEINLTNAPSSIQSLEGIEAFTNLELLDCSSKSIQSLDVSQNLNLTILRCDQNNMSSLNVATNVNLEILDCRINNLNILDVTGNTSLVELICSSNPLTTLDLSQNANLAILYCNFTDIASLDLTQNNSLTEIQSSAIGELTTLTLGSHPNLESIRATQNNLAAINVSQCPSLRSLQVQTNNLTSIDVSQNPNLEFLFFSSNQVSAINVTQNPNLGFLSFNDNPVSEIDLSQNFVLQELGADNTQLSTIDVTANTQIAFLYCANNLNLTSLFVKNGNSFVDTLGPGLNVIGSDNLSYICADDFEIFTIITSYLSPAVAANCVVNDYCSFAPGGTNYTIEGEVKIDADVNGCDSNDEPFPNLVFDVTNGSIAGTTVSNNSGNYILPLSAGMHTITPRFENDLYYTIAPTSITVDFPSNTSPVIQDFCITPNGNFNDLEVVIIPMEEARPGFDTDYKIIYKNKGTTTLSGMVSLTFDDNHMDFVTASPTADSQNIGSLSWNYTNLAPFETRSILYTMNLNTPTDANFPLNGDDILDYTATISPTMSDETPDDNVMTLAQIVVNSFDPNDKTCLEGATITEDEVGEYVHYLIRFENTGTASAINVVVKDDIDPASYEISTLKVLDGSHDFVTRIDGQEVEFIFENINLPFDDATNDGYVLFKIKTKTTLVVNDTFTNKAEIYFDFNAPIITNDEMTLVSMQLSRPEASLDASIEAYPKPTSDLLHVKGEHAIKTLELYTLQGRLVFSKAFIGNQTETNISLKTLSKGLYILKATSEKGVFIDKIIKQ